MSLSCLPLRDRPARRLPQLLAGLFLYGCSVALLIRSQLGLAPWSVLTAGLARHLPLSFGTLTNLIGAAVLLLWIPLRQRPTLGTFANILTVGWSCDLGLGLLPGGLPPAARAGLLAAGILLNGFSIAVYVGARCGPGPRDGLMTGLTAATGRSVRSVRTALELAVLAAGWLLGGGVGPGTVLYAVAVGPVAQYWMPRFTHRDGPGPAPGRAAAVPTRRTRRPCAEPGPGPGR
ncbi:YitT family protein [Streptomyces sp. NPDC088785]|uniref:membrane protein YczE n=1 Tax=Streptomyces sp. NPDC088785 TaxID=3365897 RepID=UPI00381AF48E